MTCKITFIDGTEEKVYADIDNSEIYEGLYLFKDEDENTILEVNINQVKYIRWE